MSSRRTTSSSSIISDSAVPLELSQHENLHWAASDHQTSNNLRHKTEYKHIKILGAGAYGTTHLVRNVVDQKLYALKCIKLEERLTTTTNDNESNSCGEDGTTKTLSSSNKVLREVEALSSLRSDNVVRYYAAWVERGEIEGGNSNENEEENDSSFSSELFDKSTDNTSTKHKTTNEETCNICNQQYTDWYVSYEQWGLIDAVLQPLNLCTICYKKSLPSNTSVDIREKHILPQYLYILMEYGGRTLSDVMKEIPDNDDTLRWSLFAQCVQGLYSIHEQNFYHRDIKPGNIFVQDDIAQIGDLGLSIDSEIDSSASVESSAAAGVGTFLYSAPEVEDGGMFSEKSDVYSLGIVLIELFSNFNTVMERVSVLSKIRQGGTLPKEWQLDTDQAVLARSMVDQNPSNRPSSREILQQLVQRGLLADPDKSLLMDMIEQLQIMVHEKEAEVKRLRRLLDDNGIAADALI